MVADDVTIRRACAELKIDVPIYRAQVARSDRGGRLELHLYGGRVAYWPPEEDRATRGQGDRGQAPAGSDLEGLTRDQLRPLAKLLGVKGWHDMTKAGLVQAILALKEKPDTDKHECNG